MTNKPLSIREGEPLYRQEARVGMYQVMFPYYTMAEPMLCYLPVNYKELWLYYRQGYFTAGYYTKNLQEVSNAIFEACKDGFPEAWEKEWQRVTRALTDASRAFWNADMSTFSDEELLTRYEELYKLDIDMWAISICIDALDIGADREAMQRIADTYGFTEAEIASLSSPFEPSFVTAWELALEKVTSGELSREQLKHDFFWYGVNYSDVQEVDDAFVDEEIAKAHKASFSSPASEEHEILAAHALSENPLVLFRRFIAWRDERKYLNYVGLYGLVKIARELLRRSGHNLDHANAFLPSQMHELLSGAFTPEQLAEQFNEGIFAHLTEEGEFQYYFGTEAQERWAVVEKAFSASHQHDGTDELKGTIASKGKASGRVQVIMDFNDPKGKEFKKGDILVSSMTRPEFLPLMKLAGAIVTNEGGITSHAAIVSRELGIPCIIGTKIATQVFKDGDNVEVDADKGIVRKL